MACGKLFTANAGKFQAGEETWAREELVHMTPHGAGEFQP